MSDTELHGQLTEVRRKIEQDFDLGNVTIYAEQKGGKGYLMAHVKDDVLHHIRASWALLNMAITKASNSVTKRMLSLVLDQLEQVMSPPASIVHKGE